MWLLLLIGAIVVAAVSKSPREIVHTSRQLPSGPPGLPGPISVLGEILRIGQVPSPTVIICAIAEAESLGRPDLASDIVSAFVAPVVYKHQIANARPVHAAPAAPAMYERGSCALRAPRSEADYQRGDCTRLPRAVACTPIVVPVPASVPQSAPSVPQLAPRLATEEELIAMLNTDPNAFIEMVSSRRPPVIDAPLAASPPSPPAPQVESAPVPVSAPSQPYPAPADEAVMTDAVSAQLGQLPGFAGAGVTLVDPSTGAEVFEVRWLRGYPIPALPLQVVNWPVRVVIIDNLSGPQPTEAVAPMQASAGPPEVADRTRALAPGSPLGGVSDGAWREFVVRLERELPTFDSSRHIGQYRQRRERLAELGISPRAIHGSAAAQRAALDADLADAHGHAAAGGLLVHLGRTIAVPGLDGSAAITLSGVLGVIQCAGLDGAVGWLERPNDRKRYPHTTQAFLNTNGVF